MESPETSKRKNQNRDAAVLKINSTPKNQRIPVMPGEEFSLYHLHEDSSPNIRAGQDVLEVGWGDSPEPLNIEQKFELSKTPITCKKKLEPKESPKSSIPFKRRNVRPTCSLPTNSVIDVAKYVAEVQELSKNIMKEFNIKKVDRDLFQDENLIDSTQVIEKSCHRLSPVQKLSQVEEISKSKIKNFDTEKIDRDLFQDENSIDSTEKNCDRLSPVHKLSGNSSTESKDSGVIVKNKDSPIDNVLQTFIEEEDDWLSQALSSQEITKAPPKSNFIKSKSENELFLPQSMNVEKKSLTQNCRNINNNFRRTSSFDITRPQNNPTCGKIINETKNSFNGGNVNQYSLQEIERKRLEAKYRRERKEIERRKLEALKKLEMKKSRAIKI